MIGAFEGGAATPGLLSIVIKAFNEEAKISRAIESALAASAELAPIPVEVVVADSRSVDDTVAVARRYPVRLVQLAPGEDRGCGIGQQLGYAWSRGDLVYLMDGDMVLAPGFLREAVAVLESNPRLAGVGGAVRDERIANGVDRIRVNNRSGMRTGAVKWLVGGGLYRRAAIDAAGGYAADRNLKAYEEAELGLRLCAAGYDLQRLPREAVSHLGHEVGTWALLKRHWRSRRAFSAGVLLRSALRTPWLPDVLRMHVHSLATMVWWLLLAFGVVMLPKEAQGAMFIAWLLVSVTIFGLLALLKRDVNHAVTSVCAWHYGVAAILVGLFEPMQDARLPVQGLLLHDGVSK